eukprot:359622-Chlamydomonas_euryale.AAC.21
MAAKHVDAHALAQLWECAVRRGAHAAVLQVLRGCGTEKGKRVLAACARVNVCMHEQCMHTCAEDASNHTWEARHMCGGVILAQHMLDLAYCLGLARLHPPQPPLGLGHAYT